MPSASASFEITGWDDQPFHEQAGIRLSRVRLTKKFAGDVEGESVVEMTGATAPDESAAYVAMEILDVAVHGRRGSFVLKHDAVMTRAQGASQALTIVPDTGTAELQGISGGGAITRHGDGSHTFVLDYELPES